MSRRVAVFHGDSECKLTQSFNLARHESEGAPFKENAS